MIFVDTGAWFALLISDDPNHASARAWLAANQERLVLTDYVLDETLTLLLMRGQRQHALSFGREVLENDMAELVYLTVEDIEMAWGVFQKFQDKHWSFTDCTSKVVMERLGIKTAFAFDQHFRQFGTVTIVP
jgi:predicted nucleic acid-binding protein